MSLRKSATPLLWILTWILFAFTLTADIGGYPDRLATHFNASGEADGWMRAESFRISWILIILVLNASIIGLCWVVRFLPDSLINLPHRDHWLSAGRRAHTFSSLLRTGVLLSIPLTLLFTSLYDQVIHANLKTPPQLGSRIWIEAVLAVGMMALILGYQVLAWYRPGKGTDEG